MQIAWARYNARMLKELQDIGLSEKEAKVYMAALEIGRATADQLSKHAKIVRPTTYVQIESLMKKGLMSTYEEGKKTYFAPESPELLKRLLLQQQEGLRTKEQGLTEMLPELLRQFESAGERPVVRFFPGKDGITTAREEILSTQDKQLYVLFSQDTHMSQIYSQKDVDDYTDRRNKLHIRSNAIYTNADVYKTAWVDSLTQVRLLTGINTSMDVRLFDNKTALFSTKGNIFALVIESTQITESMKSIFAFLWQQSRQG